MATRRMFSKSVVLGDDFLDLSNEAKLLYFLLGLDADDDGFFKSSKRICKVNDIEESTLDELENKDFIIRFSSGVICITDWCRNNQIQKDRYHPTEFTEMAFVAFKNQQTPQQTPHIPKQKEEETKQNKHTQPLSGKPDGVEGNEWEKIQTMNLT